MTHKELKQYVYNKRKAQAKQWADEKRMYGECTPPTVEEYEKYRDIIITGKKTYKTKFVHNKLWQSE